MSNKMKIINCLDRCWYNEKSCKERKCPYYMGEHELKVGTCMRRMHKDVITLLKDQPEIVQCKNCQFNKLNKCLLHTINTEPDNYCSWGIAKSQV